MCFFQNTIKIIQISVIADKISYKFYNGHQGTPIPSRYKESL